MIRLRLLLIGLGLLWLVSVGEVALAQPGWIEQESTYFRIIYTADDAAIAERYATLIDDVYTELRGVFAIDLPPPLTLRLYPTSEAYYTDNPAARAVPGVIAHADFRRREVVVIVERARRQTELAQINNLRHEVTHIFAAELSGGRLNVGLQEGIAQYMELPGPDTTDKMTTLRQLTQRGELWSWALLDDRNAIYRQPEVSYPQTWSIITFLIERDGFDQFRQFLTTLAASSGYRSAMAQVYGVAATTLETEWRAWLPGFLGLEAGATPPISVNLAPVRALVAAGDYERALSELERLAPLSITETQAELDTLQARAQAGQRANQLLSAARAALLHGDYEQAARLIGQAEQTYQEINDRRQEAVIASYRRWVARGLQANETLRLADEQARRFDLAGAQASAENAAREFAALGNDVRRDNALALRRAIAAQQRTLAAALLFFGAAGIAAGLIGRQLRPSSTTW